MLRRSVGPAGWLAVALLLWADLPYLVLPLSAGFFFIGLVHGRRSGNEVSHGSREWLAVDAEAMFGAWRSNPDQIALMGLLLLLHLAWMGGSSCSLFWLAHGAIGTASWDLVWYSPRAACHSWRFGVAAGAVLAGAAVRLGRFDAPTCWIGANRTCSRRSPTSIAAVRLEHPAHAAVGRT